MKTENTCKYKAGEELVITSGLYSSYHIDGVYTVVKPFDLMSEIQSYAESVGLKFTGIFVEDEENEIDLHAGLKKRLLEHGFIEVKKKYKEIHLGESIFEILI